MLQPAAKRVGFGGRIVLNLIQPQHGETGPFLSTSDDDAAKVKTILKVQSE